MIIFRRKEYSTRLSKVIAGGLKNLDKVKTKIDNAGLRAGDTVKEIVTGKKSAIPFKFQGKNRTSIYRKAIKANKAVERAKYVVGTDPGGTLGQIAGTQVTKPIIKSPATSLWAASPLSPPGTTTFLANTEAGKKILEQGPEAKVLNLIDRKGRRHKLADKSVPFLQKVGRGAYQVAQTTFV